MARTRGAAKKTVDDSAEDAPVPDQNPADEDALVIEKPTPKPRRTRSRRGKETDVDQQETDKQEAPNGDAVTVDAEEEVEAERDVEPNEEANGRTSRSRSRAGKGRDRKDKEEPQEAQLVSFPSIMDEGLNNTGTMAQFPEPYIPKPRYTPAIAAVLKKTMSNIPPKTPKFDPVIHGKDLEKDLQEDNGVDTFEQLITRSPKKKPVDNKSLGMPAPLDLGAVQVTEVELPAQTEEERKILSEEPTQAEEPIFEVKVAPEAALAKAPKGRMSKKNAPAVSGTSLTKTQAGASGPSLTSLVTRAKAQRGKKPETVKTTIPPASPAKTSSMKLTPVSPPRADTKPSTPPKAAVWNPTPAAPPRAEAKGEQTTPTRTISKPVNTSPPQSEKKPAPATPLRSPVAKTTPTISPLRSTEKSASNASQKPVPNPIASASPPRTSSKQPTPSPSPRTPSKKPTLTSPTRTDAKKTPPVSVARGAVNKPTERPIAKPVPRKPLGAVAPKAPLREKRPVVEPPPVKGVLPIRTKRVASGPAPPTKRIRPTPPVTGETAGSSQNENSVAPPVPRPRIASLNKPPPPARAPKPPTKPTGFRLVGEEVARKQAEARGARKKRMEEAEAVKASLKEKEVKARKPIPSKTSSVASKSSRGSNISAAVNRQLEREIASAQSKKDDESTKPKTSSPSCPGQPRPIKPPAIAQRPPLVIQKKAPTTKLTTATSKPSVPVTARGTAGPASSAVDGSAQLTPEQEDVQRKEQMAQVEKARKQAAEKGKAAVLAWAAQQKNKVPATAETKQVA